MPACRVDVGSDPFRRSFGAANFYVLAGVNTSELSPI
jgi:hypothetical protein